MVVCLQCSKTRHITGVLYSGRLETESSASLLRSGELTLDRKYRLHFVAEKNGSRGVGETKNRLPFPSEETSVERRGARDQSVSGRLTKAKQKYCQCPFKFNGEPETPFISFELTCYLS
ncbi:hypothetical protein L798_03811 [Zootermopsis nevadensis]|uniref:Uncharacterized protein n=1 Tax=Zootermopsis nevadensis TaxID=136037 RepID=A0A067RCW3_ZOONE|nr:hypothetical protein L798_03811 [Zootermopsis nevadensis]